MGLGDRPPESRAASEAGPRCLWWAGLERAPSRRCLPTTRPSTTTSGLARLLELLPLLGKRCVAVCVPPSVDNRGEAVLRPCDTGAVSSTSPRTQTAVRIEGD
jgi:hypothetical protein